LAKAAAGLVRVVVDLVKAAAGLVRVVVSTMAVMVCN
jgi:hypothetical protein